MARPMSLRQLGMIASPYRASLISLSLLTIVAGLAALVVPWTAGSVFASIANDRPISVVDAGLLAFSLFGSFVFAALATVESARTAANIRAKLRQRLFDHVQNLPMSFQDQQQRGDSLAALFYETSMLANFLVQTIAGTPARLIFAAGASVMLYKIDHRVALAVPVFIPAFFIVAKLISRRTRGLSQAEQTAEANAYAVAAEGLAIVPVTKAYTREGQQSLRFQQATDEVAGLTARLGRTNALIDPLMALTAAILAIGLLMLAARGMRNGTVGQGGTVSLLLYAAMLVRPVGQLSHLYNEVQVARGALGRMDALLSTEPEGGRVDGEPRARASGAIRFDEVTFAFPGRGTLFDRLTFSIDAGETVALQGANGAGKSTIVSLLLHFYQVESGQILIDGSDVATCDLAWLRRQIGLVPQSPMLFNASIHDNIAFGFAGPVGREHVRRAARLAQADDFINSLPQGYDTPIGDGGVRLSGGQRQRIALARALIKDPPILIFDEATAMVDLAGEADFIATCRTIFRDRTVLIVTHRPEMLAMADRRILIVDGRAREEREVRYQASL